MSQKKPQIGGQIVVVWRKSKRFVSPSGKLENLRLESEASLARATAAEASCKTLQATLDSKDAEIQNLKSKLTLSQEDADKQSSRVSDLQAKLSEAEKRSEEMERKVKKMEAEMAKLEEDVQTWKGKHDTVKGELDQLMKGLDEL
ncbi:hypothetical protein HDV05_001553 [Chytridiales sp. JEL 0842]|nr:hypothetical protein HDV05_001553 [Chytridiales sp. JEL 0842]